MYLYFDTGKEQANGYVLKLSGKCLLVHTADIYQYETWIL